MGTFTETPFMIKNTVVLAALCLLACSFATAQNVADDYAFTGNYIELKLYDPFGKLLIVDNAKSYFAMRGQIFTIQSSETVDSVAGYAIVFWHFGRGGKQVKPAPGFRGKTPHVIDSSDNGKVFFVKADDVKSKATASFHKPKGWLSVEGVVLPIKLRFKTKQPGGDFDFLQSVSIGPAIAKVWNYGGAFGTSSFSVLAGMNITNVSVDENSTQGVVTSKTTLLGLSPFAGMSYTYSGISLSLLTGIDILTGKAGRTWAYRKSPWFGIGVGTAIFSTASKSQ